MNVFKGKTFKQDYTLNNIYSFDAFMFILSIYSATSKSTLVRFIRIFLYIQHILQVLPSTPIVLPWVTFDRPICVHVNILLP